MRFEFSTANRIIFGEGVSKDLFSISKDLGRRPFIVTGSNPERLKDTLRDFDSDVTLFPVMGEPTIELVRKILAIAREARPDHIIAIGGGSVIDTGKAVAILVTNGGDPLDYIEIIGAGKQFFVPSLPVIAMPTTSGTGSEVTKNAVLKSAEHGVKASLRGLWLLPKIALVDPILTITLPRLETACTGMDALTQLIEPYVSTKANPITDALCLEGIRLIAKSIRRVYQNPTDIEGRSNMSLASLFSGIALANAGLGAAHGLAAVIGGSFPAPHGALCARLLPQVMKVNIIKAKNEENFQHVVERYREIAKVLTSYPDEETGVIWVKEIIDFLDLPPLSSFGIQPTDYRSIAEKSLKASSTKTNPVPLTIKDMEYILSES